jgi:hypothetical protein
VNLRWRVPFAIVFFVGVFERERDGRLAGSRGDGCECLCDRHVELPDQHLADVRDSNQSVYCTKGVTPLIEIESMSHLVQEGIGSRATLAYSAELFEPVPVPGTSSSSSSDGSARAYISSRRAYGGPRRACRKLPRDIDVEGELLVSHYRCERLLFFAPTSLFVGV